jgi:glycosyltransferase involved in cell wall biosynthesis
VTDLLTPYRHAFEAGLESDAFAAAPGRAAPYEIGVIIISTHSDPRTAAAVDSILTQDVPAEIVVVNTGRGSLRQLLEDRLQHVQLVESPRRHNVGGARNLGIAHCRASLIAFLASDCQATPGWLRRRVDAHKSGHAMVASALRPAPDPDGRISTISWAAYATTHTGRMPETPPDEAARYGLSYDRRLFERYGLFDAGRNLDEDTDFNNRCSPEGLAFWDPEILTLHDYPGRLIEALGDQFRRGSNASILARTSLGRSAFRQLVHTAYRGWVVLRRIDRIPSPNPFRSPSIRLTMLLLFAARTFGSLYRLIAIR